LLLLFLFLLLVEHVEQTLQLPVGVVLLFPVPEQQGLLVPDLQIKVLAGGLVQHVGKLAARLDVLEELLKTVQAVVRDLEKGKVR
jgi:hypothetical protein